MLDVSVRRPVAPADVAAVRRLAALAEAADGHPPLGDSVWRDLERPTPRSAVVVAELDGEPVGALHLAPPENESDSALTMAVVVDPGQRDLDVERAVLDAAIADPEVGGARSVLWRFGADDRFEQLMGELGFARDRELRQMQVALPLGVQASWPADTEVRPFRPGTDDRAWLVVNNRAFADDPDQSGWSLDTLLRREEEEWFDPKGFLLSFRGGSLAGFCWTRLHAPSPPRQPAVAGEIYVIGVDPDHRGIGLGRALVVGGLEVVHGMGAATGMLFVDASNVAAVGLYEALGFTTTRVDRAYVRAGA